MEPDWYFFQKGIEANSESAEEENGGGNIENIAKSFKRVLL